MNSERPTRAQGEILLWLHREGIADSEISGGTLISYYEQRDFVQAVARYEDRDEAIPAWLRPGSFIAGSSKCHAWRRIGGLQLRRMKKAGFLNGAGFNRGVPQYMVSAKGMAWIEEKVACDA